MKFAILQSNVESVLFITEFCYILDTEIFEPLN